MFLPIFCVVLLETSIGFMPVAGELMLNRLLIVTACRARNVEHWG